MTIEDAVYWYEKNVNYKIAKAFFKFLIKIGILKENIDLDVANLFLLETYDNKFTEEDGYFKIKKNRKELIDKFKDEKIEEKSKASEVKIKTVNNNGKKFKIENLGNKKLKLIKL